MSRHARNVDLNQKEIVAAFRDMNCQVVLMHTAAGGFPDLIVCRNGVAYFVEIKGPKGKLNALQKKFHAEWRGPEIQIVRTIDEAIEVLS